MMKMKHSKKKYLLLFCAITLFLALLMTACGEEEPTPQPPAQSDVPTDSVGTDTGSDTESDTQLPEDSESDVTPPEDSESDVTPPEDSESDVTPPEDSESDVTPPEDSESDVTPPEDSQPEDSQPEDSQPEDSQPEDSQPGDENQPPVTPTKTFNLKQYKLIYDDKASDRVVEIITNFVERVSTPLGFEIELAQDRWETNSGKELLIGISDRTETETSLSRTDRKFTFNISIIGDKICITAATPQLMVKALEYFETTYVSGCAGDGKIQLPENLNYTAPEFKYLSLVEGGNCLYDVVYPKTATVGTPMSLAAIEIREFLQAHTNPEQEVGIRNDFANSQGQFDLTQPSFVIGDTLYPRSAELSEGMTYFEWKKQYLDNQYYLYCEDSVSIKVMKQKVLAELADGVYFKDTQTVRILPPENESGLYNEWCEEIPQYVPVADEYDKKGNSKITSYTISEFTEGYFRLYLKGVTPEGAAAYNELVKKSGYTVYQQDTATANNKVSTFATYIGKDTVLHVYYLADQKAMRILVCQKSSFIPYATQPETLTAVTKPTMTIMDMEYMLQGGPDGAHDNGLGLVFTLEDGSYIIYDGGYSYDTEKLYNYLVANNKHTSGRVKIRAWVLTHPHMDHYGNYVEFAALYGRLVDLEYAVYQFDYETAMNPNATSVGEAAESRALQQIIKSVNGATISFAAKQIVPLAGQTLYFGNVSMEIFATSEMLYRDGTATSNQNDHSLISRITINGETILITGDTATASMHMRTIERTFGEELKSRFMTAPHHGLNGSDSLYLLIQPEFVIFHTDEIHYIRRTTVGDVQAGANAVLIEQLAMAEDAEGRWLKETFFAEKGAADGYRVLMLPFMGSDYFETNFGDAEEGQEDNDNWEDLLNKNQ